MRIDESLWDQLDTPILVVQGTPWRIQWCNARAKNLLKVTAGDLVQEVFKDVDLKKLEKKLESGRLAAFPFETGDRLFNRVHFRIKYFNATSLLIEGHNDTRVAEAEAISASYVKLVEQQKRQISREKEINEVALASLKNASDLISQSIAYASRIQQALLPPKDQLEQLIGNISIWWEPRDVVGGDFYWSSTSADKLTGEYSKARSGLALFDCTGHGVPGAFMTALIVPLLENISERGLLESPSIVIHELDKQVRRQLSQDSSIELTNDGLDLGICIVDKINHSLKFAGAGIDLFHLSQRHGMHKIKGANQGIGYRTAVTSINWVDHSIEFVSGDIFVMLTDGFTTQIGGPRGTAFGNRRLQEFLAECKTEKPETLMSELRILLTEWQGLHQRRDDITVLIFSPSETAKLN